MGAAAAPWKLAIMVEKVTRRVEVRFMLRYSIPMNLRSAWKIFSRGGAVN